MQKGERKEGRLMEERKKQKPRTEKGAHLDLGPNARKAN